jgi:molybdenum cofactor cytidylyltransferase|uniref:nucleotidyltransferase family protein n=3 Tax=Algoriphagus sp. TaxID=1872435 RepID=UPI0040485BEE
MKTGVILLAAGSSSRLGKPKQLINYQGKTLIQHSIEAAQHSAAHDLVVVLGCNPDLIQTGIESKAVPVLVHAHWKEGMSSSMQCGLRYLIETSQPDQVILMLCDQPYVTQELLDQLINVKKDSGIGIVACSYAGTAGVPALFDQFYFPELLALKGAEGAKKVILNHQADTVLVDFPLGAVDLDTEEDVRKFTGYR